MSEIKLCSIVLLLIKRRTFFGTPSRILRNGSMLRQSVLNRQLRKRWWIWNSLTFLFLPWTLARFAEHILVFKSNIETCLFLPWSLARFAENILVFKSNIETP